MAIFPFLSAILKGMKEQPWFLPLILGKITFKQLTFEFKPYYDERFHRFQKYPCLFGHCNVCGLDTAFWCDQAERGSYRESLVCARCLTTSRYRSIARGLLIALKRLTGVNALSLSELPPSYGDSVIKIYDTQMPMYWLNNAYPIPDLLARCKWIDMHLSQFKPHLEYGASLGPNTTNQNLEALTYPDNSFDIVITSDVMEHVRLDERAHAEIHRVLKPGGIYLFTVPHTRGIEDTIVRVAVRDPADPTKDEFLMEKEYHGDANAPDLRALSFRAYGLDLDKKLKTIGFEVEYWKEDLPEEGIVSTELFLCRCLK